MSVTKEIVRIHDQEIAISNPEKLLWPELGITKLMYVQKLAAIAPYLLTYCQNRYLTTIRFPDGIDGESFYQKNCPINPPTFVKTAELSGVTYVHLDSVPTLIWLGNLASLEFHPSFHYIGKDLPAEWIIDIDPSLEEEPRIMQAAHLIGELLKSMHIEAIPKTSGATGVQIYIPIRYGYTFAELRRIGKFIATYIVEKYPNLFTIERLKKDRGDLIYVDYLQHWPGKTLSAPYTPRAKRDATISTPLTWDEVAHNADIKSYNLLTIEQRLLDKGDLLSQVSPQSLDHVLSFIR